MPKSLTKDEASATETYAKFIAEPFEAGYGQTVGNSLRRVLLSSVEGAAITSIRITGAQHEFATLTGIVEDVTDIVLNLKKIKFKAVDHEPRTVTINVNKEGQITAGDIQTIQGIEVLNTNQVICTVDKKQNNCSDNVPRPLSAAPWHDGHGEVRVCRRRPTTSGQQL